MEIFFKNDDDQNFILIFAFNFFAFKNFKKFENFEKTFLSNVLIAAPCF